MGLGCADYSELTSCIPLSRQLAGERTSRQHSGTLAPQTPHSLIKATGVSIRGRRRHSSSCKSLRDNAQEKTLQFILKQISLSIVRLLDVRLATFGID